MTNLLEYDIDKNNITQPNFKGEKTPKKHFFAPWHPWAHFACAPLPLGAARFFCVADLGK